MKRIWGKFLNLLKTLLRELKDKKNIVIFLIVFVVLSCEVWVPFILGIITHNAWFYGIGATCWAFWLAPFTPFLPICIALTFAIRKVVDRHQNKTKKKNKNNVENSKNNEKEQS